MKRKVPGRLNDLDGATVICGENVGAGNQGNAACPGRWPFDPAAQVGNEPECKNTAFEYLTNYAKKCIHRGSRHMAAVMFRMVLHDRRT